jgi:hypothetical protein
LNDQLAAQPREETWSLTPSPAGWQRLRHRSRGKAALPATPQTGPGAEGGGGWPMHATAQPWHAEGRLLPTEALRCLLSSLGQRPAVH